MDGSLKMSFSFQPSILPPYHLTSLQSVVLKRDVQRIVAVKGYSKSAQSIATVQIARTYRFLELILVRPLIPNSAKSKHLLKQIGSKCCQIV